MALPDEMDAEVARERFCLVVKVVRCFAHSMLFRCGAISSAPFVGQRLIGTHVEVTGDEFLRVGRGTYVVLETLNLPTEKAMNSMSAWGWVEGQGTRAL